MVENYKNKPEILYTGNQPCYKPIIDQVFIPPITHFRSSETFYRSLFHELSHSTGHNSRLNRLQHYNDLNKTDNFESDYACEELIAEFSSAFLANGEPIELLVLTDNQGLPYTLIEGVEIQPVRFFCTDLYDQTIQLAKMIEKTYCYPINYIEITINENSKKFAIYG